MSAGVSTPRTRNTARLRELRFDGGTLSLNLIATVGRRPSSPIERLDGLDRLGAWCEGVNLALDPDDATPALVTALHDLRSAAYDVVVAYLHSRTPQPESVDLVNRLAQVEPPAPRLRIGRDGLPESGGSPRLAAPALLSVIARDAITLITAPDLRGRLRECDSEICRMIYLDTAQGKPRKWCSMQRCGNSAKAARHRGRFQ
ncbi:ABATE domain-containing protein [Streptomyces sp. RB6PN25]|uniref:ABATE domain-containing protein n=1 Tax=Streptomyces humicola TaxID=2953240 RepID=A0ABT1PPN2_9ACTN|nr:CGNR zinc finger domain-containing protein [Streptomyces humicola]MCQ4079073.1 ABATE domain-containing protein [Streptomyces humicola]